MLRNYYNLTKPGIIRGNAVTAVAGFLLASKGHINFGLLLASLGGLLLIIASACVFNNYVDRDIDRLMARTKHRALAAGEIAGKTALIYAGLLGLAGAALLALYTNLLTLAIALLGFFFYVVIYGFFKRRSVYGTIVGSVSGATPPVVGYCAVTNHFDSAAAILFMILVFWQMPHFYAIAMYRRDDYAIARIPVLPIKKGMHAAKLQILLYIIAFTIAAAALSLFDHAGYTYLVVAVFLGLTWLGFGLKNFSNDSDKFWGRKMFFVSLFVITALSIVISLNAWLP